MQSREWIKSKYVGTFMIYDFHIVSFKMGEYRVEASVSWPAQIVKHTELLITTSIIVIVIEV